jgi:hypothetical protein
VRLSFQITPGECQILFIVSLDQANLTQVIDREFDNTDGINVLPPNMMQLHAPSLPNGSLIVTSAGVHGIETWQNIFAL